MSPNFIFSIVSHGHGLMIFDLLSDIRTIINRYEYFKIEILLTFNIPEETSFLDNFSDLPLTRIDNVRPLGFGANHNAAFKRSRGQYFVVLNPDARIAEVDLDLLIAPFALDRVGVVAPKVVDCEGRLQDNARRFPTLKGLVQRVVTSRRESCYGVIDIETEVDWVAGMFVAVRRDAWISVGGFDEGFFMYFEDVDFCMRLQMRGWVVVYQPYTSIVHDAQRASHRQILHLKWHIKSAVRYFLRRYLFLSVSKKL